MLIGFKRSQTSIKLRVKILDSSVSTGAGKTGLTHSSAGLIISTITDNEATPTIYAQGSSNVETITTLGTFAAPTASKCRFKEVDATNHPGVYEIQIADARFAVASSKFLLVSISGASGAVQTDIVIPLTDVDPYATMAAQVIEVANGLETGKTVKEGLRLMAAALAGRRTNAGTLTEQFDAIGNSGTARIVTNCDADGNGTPTLTP